MDNDYELMRELYNQLVDKLFDAQKKLENNEIEFSEVEKLSNIVIEQYKVIYGAYVVELAKYENKIPQKELEKLARLTGTNIDKLKEEISEKLKKENIEQPKFDDKSEKDNKDVFTICDNDINKTPKKQNYVLSSIVYSITDYPDQKNNTIEPKKNLDFDHDR